MNKSITGFLAFVVGAAAGSVVTWKLVKTKYEKIAQEEIESVREVYSGKKFEPKKFEPKKFAPEPPENEEELRERYSDILKHSKYVNWENEKIEEGVPDDLMNTPHVILPEEVGAEDGYDLEILTYYSDGVLTDDWDNPIEDVHGMVGDEFASHFGQNVDDPDTVYVRNDEQKMEYEIQKDLRNYSDIPKRQAYQLVDENE